MYMFCSVLTFIGDKLMSKKHRDYVLYNLVPHVTPDYLDSIINDLYSEKVLSTFEVDCIKSKTRHITRYACFAELLIQKQDKAFRNFISALCRWSQIDFAVIFSIIRKKIGGKWMLIFQHRWYKQCIAFSCSKPNGWYCDECWFSVVCLLVCVCVTRDQPDAGASKVEQVAALWEMSWTLE